MIESQGLERSRLWISYLWTNREEKDFSYLVPHLSSPEVEPTFDSIELQPDLQLWQRIEQRLLAIDFTGWLYVLTHQVLTRKACADGLISGINKMLLHKGPAFPMVGLMYGIKAQYLPAPLRMRPCLSLEDSEWKNQLSGVLKQLAASTKKQAGRRDSRFTWKIHHGWGGDSSATAVEVAPGAEDIRHWRFAIPKETQVARWGLGAAGGGEILPPSQGVAMGYGKFGSTDVAWFGATGGITGAESAYIVFSGAPPEVVCFGPAENPMGPPRQMEIVRIGGSNPTISQPTKVPA